jgi:hypothetical protein
VSARPSEAAIAAIEAHFHALVRQRLEGTSIPVPVALPCLGRLGRRRGWLEVPGMCGGFAYRWDPDAAGPVLLVESWSRVVDGSEQEHRITAAGAALVRDGADGPPPFVILRPGR